MNDLVSERNMDKGKPYKTYCKSKKSINKLGRCETCQTKIDQTYTERLRRKNERRKQERLDNPDKFREREKKYREANSEKIKASKKEYSKIEIDCEFCECKVKKCRWKAHMETQKHTNNGRSKRKEEEKPSKMTVEEKDECFKIQKLKNRIYGTE